MSSKIMCNKTKNMKFCVQNSNKQGPHPLLVWLALSYWGSDLVSCPCPNVIHFNTVSSLGQTTTVTDMDNRVLRAEIQINTLVLATNALVYNVLLHEVGHANGLHHSNGGHVMLYTLLLNGTGVVDCVPFLGDEQRYIPFLPCDRFVYEYRTIEREHSAQK